jgi:hypothetical protein
MRGTADPPPVGLAGPVTEFQPRPTSYLAVPFFFLIIWLFTPIKKSLDNSVCDINLDTHSLQKINSFPRATALTRWGDLAALITCRDMLVGV